MGLLAIARLFQKHGKISNRVKDMKETLISVRNLIKIFLISFRALTGGPAAH
jgi:hypothetical protein